MYAKFSTYGSLTPKAEVECGLERTPFVIHPVKCLHCGNEQEMTTSNDGNRRQYCHRCRKWSYPGGRPDSPN